MRSTKEKKEKKETEKVKKKVPKKEVKTKDNEILETKKFLDKLKKKNPGLFQKENKLDFSEFYDLPHRYNETSVKLLSQTPTKLFVYWDISKKDIDDMKKKYSYNFFNETIPVIILLNKDTGETFETEVNDFANSWYIDIPDSASSYEAKLFRKYKNRDEKVEIVNSNTFISSDGTCDNLNYEEILFQNINTNEKYYIKNNDIQKEKIANLFGFKLEDFAKIDNIHRFLGSS